jgi:excisionase family DNA binding protein
MRALMQALREEPSVSVEDAGKALGIGRSSAYAAIESGELPYVKIGRRIAVPTAWLRRKLHMEQSAA